MTSRQTTRSTAQQMMGVMRQSMAMRAMMVRAGMATQTLGRIGGVSYSMSTIS